MLRVTIGALSAITSANYRIVADMLVINNRITIDKMFRAMIKC